MKKSLLIAIAMLAITVFSDCTAKQVPESTINLQLQNSVDRIVKQDMKEFAAQEGIVIVMETSTGNLRAVVGWKEDKGKVVEDTTLLSKARETFLFRGASLLAALETGKVTLDDMFHTYAGIDVIGQDTIYDHNWQKGGYGELTLLQGLAYNSSIAIDKAVDVAYQNKDVFLQKLQQMGLEKDSTFKGSWSVYALGFHHRRPTSMVSFFNAIANGGKMVSPKLQEGSAIVVDSMIAKKKNIESMQKALRFFVTNGLGKKAESKMVNVAGISGSIHTEDGIYADFCGYFPIEKPKYTVFVSYKRPGTPAPGGNMAGRTFRKIAELLKKTSNKNNTYGDYYFNNCDCSLYLFLYSKKAKPTEQEPDVSTQPEASADIQQEEKQDEPPHTKDLCIELLKQLNCEVTTSKENENRLYFEYQGEHIVIDASNDSYFIEMWDPWWLIVPLDDLEQMSNVRKAINVTNSWGGTTVYYTIEEEQKFVLHSKRQCILPKELPNVKEYLMALLNDFFTVKKWLNEEIIVQQNKEN